MPAEAEAAAAAVAEPFVLDKSQKVLHLVTLPEDVFVFRYAASTKVPAELLNNNDGQFVSVTKSKLELSIVGPKDLVVNSGLPKSSEEHHGGPWRILKVRGPLEHRELYRHLWQKADERHGRRHVRARARAEGGTHFDLHDLHLVSCYEGGDN